MAGVAVHCGQPGGVIRPVLIRRAAAVPMCGGLRCGVPGQEPFRGGPDRDFPPLRRIFGTWGLPEYLCRSAPVLTCTVAFFIKIPDFCDGGRFSSFNPAPPAVIS